MSRRAQSHASRLAVRRACLVCEWTDEVIEAPDADPDCPWCHAPTVRLEVISDAPEAGARSHAAALGRIGGRKGGHARAASLTAERRRDIAREAARARWQKKGGSKEHKG